MSPVNAFVIAIVTVVVLIFSFNFFFGLLYLGFKFCKYLLKYCLKYFITLYIVYVNFRSGLKTYPQKTDG